MSRRFSTRHRLALIGSVAVVLAMLAAMVAFNAIEWELISQEAIASVDDSAGWSPQAGVSPSRTTYGVELDSSYSLVADEASWYSDLDYAIADWCAQHPELNVVSRVELDGSTCYVELVESDDIRWSGRYLAIYADVTSQENLMHTITAVFLGIAVLGGAAAGLAGWKVGKRIEAADEARKHFYENMSHELKTPVAAIRGYAEGMQAGVVEVPRGSAAIVRESERMSQLIEQILGLSRLEAGAVKINPAPVEMEDFVQDCLMPFEGITRTRNLDVELDLAPGTANLDAELMGHALENVLSNAMRHADHVVRVTYDGHALVVANDGDLPSADELPHLFDRFHTRSEGGAGIGLALAHEIVALHGWQLRAELHDDLFWMVVDMG